MKKRMVRVPIWLFRIGCALSGYAIAKILIDLDSLLK